MASAEFVEAEGMVHLVAPHQPEFTLCGDAFDLDEEDGYEQRPTAKRRVDCPVCASIIDGCRGVQVSRQEPYHAE